MSICSFYWNFNWRANFIHNNFIIFLVFSLFKIVNLRKFVNRMKIKTSENYLPRIEQHFNQWNVCKFSQYLFIYYQSQSIKKLQYFYYVYILFQEGRSFISIFCSMVDANNTFPRSSNIKLFCLVSFYRIKTIECMKIVLT